MKHKWRIICNPLGDYSNLIYPFSLLGRMLLAWLYLLVVTGCQSTDLPPATPTVLVAANREVEPTSTATSTSSPSPSEIPVPTDTPVPEDTATPTKTARPTPTYTLVPEGVEVVKMRTSDNTELVGYLQRSESRSEGNLVVVLAHMHVNSHREWDYFNALLVENGFSTMRFDFRGHGASGGSDQLATIGDDVKTVIEYVKKQGFKKIVCIGAQMGGTGCVAAAVKMDIDGLVSLSGALHLPYAPRLVTKSELQNLTIPKIFMVSKDDLWPGALEGVRELNEQSPQPKQYYEYEGIAHGTGLFFDEDGEEVLQILLDFLIDLSE